MAAPVTNFLQRLYATHATVDAPGNRSNAMTEPRESNYGLRASDGIASNRHQGLRRPADDQRVEQSLDHVGLEDRGDVLEDHLRDRRSRGAEPASAQGRLPGRPNRQLRRQARPRI